MDPLQREKMEAWLFIIGSYAAFGILIGLVLWVVL
jgi:hypothetical protein